MKTLNINGKNFQLSKEVFAFLDSYRKRIEDYVQKNAIDLDLHEDILQRLADKLTEQEMEGTLDQKSVIQIVNDLGEAEEIFSDEIDSFEAQKEGKKEKSGSKDQASLAFYQKLQKAKRSRPQEGAIIRGVCKMLEQLTGWSVWIWRGLFLAQFIFGFTLLVPLSFGGYVLCALVFPRKEKEYGQRSVFNYFFKQFFDLFLVIPNFSKSILGGIKSIFSAARPTTGNLVVRLWKFLLRGIRTGVLLFINGILIFGLLFLGVVFYFLITGLEYYGMDFSLIFPTITTRGVLSGIIFLTLLSGTTIGWLLRKSILPKFIRILTIGTGAFAGIALFATIGEVFLYHGRGNFLHKETIELIKPQNSKDFTIDIHSLPEIKSLIFPSGNQFIRQNRTIHLHPTFDQSFKAEYTYTIYFAQNKKGKARFQQMIEHLIKPSQKREGNTLHLGYFEPELFNQAVPATIIHYSIDLYVPTEYLFTLLQDGEDRAGFVFGLEMPNWQLSNSRLICHSKMSYNKEKEKFSCEMKMTTNDKKWLVEQYLRDHADEIVALKGLNPDWSNRYNRQDPYWNLHSIQRTTEHGLLAKYSDQFFNLFIEMSWDIDNTHQVKLKNLWIKELEQKGRMNPERMKKYTGWETLEKFDILFQQDTDPLNYENQYLQEENKHLKEENQRLQQQVKKTSQTNETIPGFSQEKSLY